MWTRAQLKDKAKKAIHNNYWKLILVSLLVTFISGGAAISSGTTISTSFLNGFMDGFESETDDLDVASGALEGDGFYYENEFSGSFSSGDFGGLSSGQIEAVVVIVLIVMAILFGVILVSFVIRLAYTALLWNPVTIGTNRFFVKSLDEKAEIKEVAFGFDNNYKNIVKILFIKDLKLMAWSLLFVIPGIIKGYEYMMVPYLLAENPNLTQDEVFRLSKQMMKGNKFEAFILELSFIGWDILSSMTAGLLATFYVNPYKNLTFAALYEELSAINGYPARVVEEENTFEENEYFPQNEEVSEYTEEYAPEE